MSSEWARKLQDFRASEEKKREETRIWLETEARNAGEKRNKEIHEATSVLIEMLEDVRQNDPQFTEYQESSSVFQRCEHRHRTRDTSVVELRWGRKLAPIKEDREFVDYYFDLTGFYKGKRLKKALRDLPTEIELYDYEYFGIKMTNYPNLQLSVTADIEDALSRRPGTKSGTTDSYEISKILELPEVILPRIDIALKNPISRTSSLYLTPEGIRDEASNGYPYAREPLYRNQVDVLIPPALTARNQAVSVQ